MKSLISKIKDDAGYTPVTLYEREMLYKAIALGYVKVIGRETSDEYIALLVTPEGNRYLRQNS